MQSQKLKAREIYYVCDAPHCFKYFSRSHRLESHKLTHTGERPFKCSECSKSYTRSTHLKRHVSNSHRSHPLTQSPSSIFKSSFESKENTTKHKGLSTEVSSSSDSSRVKVYSCSHCDKTFAKHSYLKAHIATVNGLPHPHECVKCHKTFRFPNKLSRHIKVHESKVCELCQESFSTMTSLKAHKKALHPTLYTCSDCGKTFSASYPFKKHILTHSALRKVFHCSIANCGKFYYFEKNLRTHVSRIHEGLKSFECPNCRLSLSSKQKLTLHLSKKNCKTLTKEKVKTVIETAERKGKGKTMAAQLSNYRVETSKDESKDSELNFNLESIQREIESNSLLNNSNWETPLESRDSVQLCHRRFKTLRPKESHIAKIIFNLEFKDY